MKRHALALIFVLSLTLINKDAKASHLVGGEITWECVQSSTNAGKFIFRVRLYRACYIGAAGLSTTANIRNPLYSKYGGPTTIGCSRVSQADLSKPCFNPKYEMSCGIPLSAGGGSAVEEYVYLSSPVQINGIPDTSGSEFYWTSCCRPALVNVNGSGYYLRSVMYPYRDPTTNTYRSLGSSTGGPTCYDSSPRFVAKPSVAVCARQNVLYEHMMFDVNNDSIRYDWSIPMQSLTNPITWKTNYSTNLQLPNKAYDTNNVNPVLDTTTGVISFNTNTPLFGYHSISIKASSYKKGQKVAEVYRDIVITIIDCDTITSNPKVYNRNRPAIGIKETTSSTYLPAYQGTYPVGSSITLDIKVDDVDSLPTNPVSLQSVDLEILGISMSGTPNDATNCMLAPCAYLDSNNISWNGVQFIDTSTLAAQFTWNTSCLNLEDYSTPSGGNPMRKFTFQVKSKDNWCPVPAEGLSFITIILVDTSSSAWPVDTVDASRGGGYVSWLQYSGSNFNSYEIFRSYNLASPWTFVTSISNIGTTSFHDINANTHIASTFYLIEVNNGPGCYIDYEVKSIYLDVTETKKRSQLKWNRPYTNTVSYNNGTYYIYRRDTLNTWNLIDSTSFGMENYLDSSVVYNEMIDYKIESKDPYGLFSISNADSLRIDSVIPGISDNIRDRIKLYPNPVNDILTIDFEIFEDKYQLQIIDLSGKEVYRTRIKDRHTEIDISEIRNGFYFIRIENDHGEVHLEKIVKRE